MGFECGFDTVRRWSKYDTVEEYIVFSEYLKWKNNQWNFETRKTIDGGDIIPAPYPTWLKYWESTQLIDNDTNMDAIAKEIDLIKDSKFFINKVKFYESLNLDTYSYSRNLDFWCSSGKYIDNFIIENLTKINDYLYEGIDDKFIDAALKWVDSKLETCKLIPAILESSYNDDTKTTIDCNGIIYREFDEENLCISDITKGIFTNDDREDIIVFIPSDGYDYDMYLALVSFKECLLKINELLIDGNNLIWYYRSW